MDPANTDCGMLQDYVDGYADDLEEDGTLSDSLIAPLAYTAYLYNSLGNVMHSGETGLIGRDEYDLMAALFPPFGAGPLPWIRRMQRQTLGRIEDTRQAVWVLQL